MYIVEQKGDLLKGFKFKEVECIAHVANAQCTMRSGVAFQIREAYLKSMRRIVRPLKVINQKWEPFHMLK